MVLRVNNSPSDRLRPRRPISADIDAFRATGVSYRQLPDSGLTEKFLLEKPIALFARPGNPTLPSHSAVALATTTPTRQLKFEGLEHVEWLIA